MLFAGFEPFTGFTGRMASPGNTTSLYCRGRCKTEPSRLMRHLLILLVLLNILACQNKTGKINSGDETQETPKVATAIIDNELSKNPIIGQWLNQAYYSNLVKTKSPLIAQTKAYLTHIYFKPDKSVELIYSFHEGVTKNYSIENDTIKIDDDFAFLLNNTTMIFGDKNHYDTLIKYETFDSNRNNIAINNLIFSGLYNSLSDSATIEFRSDGIVNGLKNYNTYRAREDYYDIGLDVDILYLRGPSQQIECTWEINGDTMFVFKTICNKTDSSDDCVERGKGVLIYKLLKTK